MASTREQVLQAVVELVKAALPNATVRRNAKPPRLADCPGGLVMIFDGSPGEPEIDLSPLRYNYQHRIVLAFGAYDSASKTQAEVVDELQQAVGARIAADRTLGGLCDWLEPVAPDNSDVEMLGAELGDLGLAGVEAHYATLSPL